jgi:ABC-type transporter Mla subunit MlaD
MRRLRPHYVAAALTGVVGLVVAVLIAVAGDNVPTAPTSYKLRVTGLAPAADDAVPPGGA